MERFEVRKANGVWHVLDTHTYEVVAAFHANHRAFALMEAGIREADAA